MSINGTLAASLRGGVDPADPPWYSEADDDARLRSYYEPNGVWAQIVDDGVFVQTLAPMVESPFNGTPSQRSRQNSCEMFCCGALFIEEADQEPADSQAEAEPVGQEGLAVSADPKCGAGDSGTLLEIPTSNSLLCSPTSLTPRKSPRYVQRRQKSNVRQKSLLSLTSQPMQTSRSSLLSDGEHESKQRRMGAALARRFPSRSEEMINWAVRNFQVGGYAARWLQQGSEASVQTSATRPGPALKLSAKVLRNQLVHLDWKPPASDGGAEIFAYEVQMRSNDLVLPSPARSPALCSRESCFVQLSTCSVDLLR